VIRPAAGADVTSLELLWCDYRVEAADGRLADPLDWRRWIMPRIAAGDVRVGLVDRTVTAYVAWQRLSALVDTTDRQLSILELYVHPNGRGRRIGSGLLARAIDAARQRGCSEVLLESNVRDEAVQALALPFGFHLRDDVLVLPLRLG